MKKKTNTVKNLKDIPTETGAAAEPPPQGKKAKVKQVEMPLKGEGVEIITDKKLIMFGDDFIDTRDEKAKLAEKLTGLEKNILERMDEIGVKVFRFSDQIVTAKVGARHVKIKTVKVTGDSDSGDENKLGEEA